MNAFPRLIRWALLALALPVAPVFADETAEGRLYAPGPFERLELAGAVNVRLSQGQKDQVFVIAPPEVLRDLEVDLQGDKLLIHPGGGWKFWHSERLQVDVMMRNIRQLVLSGASDVRAAETVRVPRLMISIAGSGQVRFDDLMADTLIFGIFGAGDGLLKGQVGDLNLSISGKGKFNAEQLRVDRALISVSGIGKARVWVQDELRVSASGIADIDYWGSPDVRRDISGLSKITAKGEKRPVPAAQGSPSQ